MSELINKFTVSKIGALYLTFSKIIHKNKSFEISY